MTADRAASSPMSSGATSSSRVAVVPGEGFLVRRPNALFFSPVEPRDPLVAALLEAFEAAPDDTSASTAVTDAVVAAAFDAAPFAVVAWTDGLEVVVLGGVEVRTDHPALPMLSGAGSGSWVERRLGAFDGAVTVSVGGPPEEQSDLVLGRVRAGGFAAIVRPGVPGRPASGDGGTEETPSAAPAANVAAHDLGADEAGRRLEGIAALRAATGGDWMEESLGLGPRDPAPPAVPVPSASAANAAPEPRAAAFAGDPDDEVTLGGDDESLPSATRSPPAWPGDPATTGRRQHVDPRARTG